MSDPFFLRYRWPDQAALTAEIAEASDELAAARKANDTAAEVDNACRLAVALTAADREAEAADLLETALPKARATADHASIGFTLLYLATARQYLGERVLAQTMFAEALDIATAHSLRDLEHYAWHHRGRCFAEMRDLPAARDAFERALKIRIELKEPRAERTRQAIALLDTL
jgi:tetratricopeptide (TPR) repeat protein